MTKHDYLTRKWHHVLSAWSSSILKGKDNTGGKQKSPWASMLIDVPRSSLICMQTTSLWIFGFPHHSNRAAKPCRTVSHQKESCLGIARQRGKGLPRLNLWWKFSSLWPWQLTYNSSQVPRVTFTVAGRAVVPAFSWETNGGMQQFHCLLTRTEPLHVESFRVRQPSFCHRLTTARGILEASPPPPPRCLWIFTQSASLVSVYLRVLISPPLSLTLSCFLSPSHSMLFLLPSRLQNQPSAHHFKVAC